MFSLPEFVIVGFELYTISSAMTDNLIVETDCGSKLWLVTSYKNIRLQWYEINIFQVTKNQHTCLYTSVGSSWKYMLAISIKIKLSTYGVLQ